MSNHDYVYVKEVISTGFNMLLSIENYLKQNCNCCFSLCLKSSDRFIWNLYPILRHVAGIHRPRDLRYHDSTCIASYHPSPHFISCKRLAQKSRKL